MQGFEQLSSTEIQQLLEAPARVMLLIAGADGKIDREEKYWSDRLLKARTYSKPKELNEYYRSVSTNFSVQIDLLLKNYAAETEERIAQISGELEALNDIFPKLDAVLAAKLYRGMLSLAEETARASGGFLRFGAVSAAEDKLVSLPMLDVIDLPVGIDETEDWDDWDEKSED